jgi:hypothetical protein
MLREQAPQGRNEAIADASSMWATGVFQQPAKLRVVIGRLLGIALLLLAGCTPDDGAAQPPQGCAGDDCAPFTVPQCASGTMLQFGSTECLAVGWTQCSHPFEPDPSGWGCREVLPAAPCPAGTMAELGSSECQPVGWTTCPKGFEPDPSGWGCRPVVTEAPCSGATRASLGSPVCTPVGDCSAPFPPAGATLFVDDDYTADELDGTHFATISAALFAATPGDSIAIEAGSYAEALSVEVDVTIAGRCAEQVIIDGTADFYPGVWLHSVAASLSGVTLLGHSYGALAEEGAELTLLQTVIQDARYGGVIAGYPETKVRLEESVVRGTIGSEFQQTVGVQAHSGAAVEILSSDIVENETVGVSAILGGTVLLQDAIVRDTVPMSYPPAGLMVNDNSVMTVSRSAILRNADYAAYVTGASAKLDMSDTAVAGTYASFDPSMPGYGIYVSYGAVLEADHCAFDDESPITSSGNAAIELEATVVRHAPQIFTPPATLVLRRSAVLEGGIVAVGGTTLMLDASLLRGSPESDDAGALRVSGAGAFAEISGSTIEDAAGWGLWVDQTGAANVSGSLVRGTVAMATDPSFPVGLSYGMAATGGGYLTLSQCAVIGNVQHGIYTIDEFPVPSSVTATQVVVRGTTASAEPNAPTAAVAVRAGAIVSLSSSAIADNESVGVLVSDAKTSVSLTQTVVRGTHAAVPELARGLWVANGGHASVQTSALVDNVGIGAAVADLGSVLGGTQMLVLGTTAEDDADGRGVVVEAGGQLELVSSALLASEGIALQASGLLTFAKLTSSVLGDASHAAAAQSPGPCGVSQDGAKLNVITSRVFGCRGVGLAFFAAEGAVTTCVLDHNHTALHAQDGSTIVSDEDEALLPVVVSGSTHYIANGERIGTGTLPSPELPTSAPVR